MPVSRRHIARVNSSTPKVPIQTSSKQTCDSNNVVLVAAPDQGHILSYRNRLKALFLGNPNKNLDVKGIIHCRIPIFPRDDSFAFEVMFLIFSFICLGVQYMNIYKTTWQALNSFTTTVLHYDKIDEIFVFHLIILLSRRFLAQTTYSLNDYLKRLEQKNPGNKLDGRLFPGWFLTRVAVNLSVLAPLFALCYTSVHLLNTYSGYFFCYVHYPFVIYFFMFGLQMSPLLLGLDQQNQLAPTLCSVNAATPSGHSLSSMTSSTTTLRLCNAGPEHIREDVELLTADFNNRLNQILFISATTTYHSMIIPLFVVPEAMNFSHSWCQQMSVIVFVISICLCSVVYLPPNYLDNMHRCARHLGKWTRVGPRNVHVPYQPWSELTLWRKDSLVKHVKGLFKATGSLENSGEPGNSSHNRFFFLFSSPMRVTSAMLYTVFATLVYEFYLLHTYSQWNQCVSMVFLIFYTQMVMFVWLRTWFVIKACYF